MGIIRDQWNPWNIRAPECDNLPCEIDACSVDEVTYERFDLLNGKHQATDVQSLHNQCG
jgi:hypothetical protein